MVSTRGDGWETIPAMTAAASERLRGRLAIVDGDTRLTYAGLVEAAQTFAAALVASGVAPGDRVAIWLFNGIEWVVAVLGIFEAGAVLVPIASGTPLRTLRLISVDVGV